MNIIEQLEQEQMAKLAEARPIPDFQAGDTLRVHVKVIEGSRERVQVFEGVCIARKHNAMNSAFTVRKISYGEGVERVFPLYSPRCAGRSYIICGSGAANRRELRSARRVVGRKPWLRPNRRRTAIAEPIVIAFYYSMTTSLLQRGVAKSFNCSDCRTCGGSLACKAGI